MISNGFKKFRQRISRIARQDGESVQIQPMQKLIADPKQRRTRTSSNLQLQYATGSDRSASGSRASIKVLPSPLKIPEEDLGTSPPTPSNFSEEDKKAEERLEDRYFIDDSSYLGQGTFGAVYLAFKKSQQTAVRKRVAVKKIVKAQLYNEDETLSIRREIENHQHIKKHRHVIKMLDDYETPDTILLFFEFAECGDLARLLQRRRKVSENEAKKITKEILSGLAHIHAAGVAHLDLNPANILFTHNPEVHCSMCSSSYGCASPNPTVALLPHTSPEDLRVKICDFGLSRKVPCEEYRAITGDANKIPFKGLVGTELYMAPEIVSRQNYGKSADVWSVGVMMYKIMSGMAPFIPPRACIQRKPAFPGYLWDKVSPQAPELISRVLQLCPEERATSEQALQDSWINNKCFSDPPNY